MSEDEKRRTNAQREDWVNRHMGRTSVETAQRLLTTAQPRPPADAPTLQLRGVRARCVAGRRDSGRALVAIHLTHARFQH